LSDNRPVNAAAALSVATLVQPDNFRANHLLARSLIRLGRWAQAKHYAEKASELKPDNDQNTKLLARIARKQA
jgi:Flp pilus assembly protein TadD